MPPKRMTANPVRPARYRAGKPLPGDRADESSGDEDEEDDEDEPKQKVAAPPVPKPQPVSAGKIISTGLQKVDLNKRFQKTSDDERTSDEEDEDDDEDDKAASDSDNVTSRRPAPSGDYASESDDSDDSDDSSSEEEAPRRKLIRPTFIPKSKRNLPESTSDPTSTSAAAESSRKAEAQSLVESAIRREAMEKTEHVKSLDDKDMAFAEPPDDTDDLDPAAERAAWKLRELLRIKRAREAIEQMEKEREEVEARRNMDADDRLKEDMEYVRKQRSEAQEKKGKMGFMQKFYHKGAFYQDDKTGILDRNYATARVEDDVVNREVLPKALQVRAYDQLGKRGQTKWTHLAAEDTSNLGREDGYGGPGGWGQKKRAGAGTGGGKFEELTGMRDERFMSDRMREKKERERNGDTDMRDAPSGPRDRDRREDRYRPGGDEHETRRDRDHSYRRREGSRDRKRDRSRSPRRDRGTYDSRRDDRRSNHDRDDRDDRHRDRRDEGKYKSRWDQQDRSDRKREGDESHADEKRRKIDV